MVDIYLEPTREGYRFKVTLKAGDSLRCSGLPEVTFAIAEIFPK